VDPTISPNGERLVYAKQVRDSNIWAVGAQPGSLPRWVVSSTHLDRNPTFSPNGERIAFDSNRSGAMEIYTAASDGSNAVQVTSFSAHTTNPRWSPDRKNVVFDSNVAGDWNIYLLMIGDKLRCSSPQAPPTKSCRHSPAMEGGFTLTLTGPGQLESGR
jgi:Tol biopolymer transport system component